MVRLAIWATAKVLVSRRDPSCKAHYYLIWGKFEHLFSVAMRNFLCVGRTDRGMLKKRSRLIPRNKGIINRVLHTLLFGDSRPISNDRATRGNRAIVLKEGEAEPTLLHPTRVFPPRPIFSPGGVPLILFRLFLPQRACWQQRLILAAISRRITLPRRAA